MPADAAASPDPRQGFEPDSAEPAALWWREASPPDPDVRAFRFELTSRGDRVPGRLWRPKPPGRAPVVLLQHGAGGSKDASYLDATAIPWVRAGAAVASIDFPLHGERTSGKLTGMLISGLAPRSLGGDAPHLERLWREFARQAVIDLRRTLDALSARPEVDASRAVYAGFSLGAVLGAFFCGADPRPRAAALALGAGGVGPSDLDPARHLARFAPRPVLLVNASRDERIPRAAADALAAGAGDPKQVVWVDAGHTDLPGSALKTMWEFLREPLGLGGGKRSAQRAEGERRPQD